MLPDKIFGLFSMYGLMIGVGIILCFVVLYVYGKHAKINNKFLDFVFYNGIVSIIGGFFFAYLFQAVLDYIKNPSAGFHFQNLTFMGGLIGGAVIFLIGYFIFRNKYPKGEILKLLKIVPCCILIAHAFGRIGCFCAGCCYGIETDSWLGVEFPSHPGVKVYPTQLFEAIFLFLLFGLCTLLFYKRDFKYNLPLYMIAYGVFRFCIEFIRGDDRGANILGMSPSQFWSILLVLGGIAVIFLIKYLYKKQGLEYANVSNSSQVEENKIEKGEIKEKTEEKLNNSKEQENIEEGEIVKKKNKKNKH